MITIGENSQVQDGSVIGKNCLIGANTLIGEGKIIPDGSMVPGSPGRVLRQLSPEEIIKVNSFAGLYVQKFKRYQSGFKPEE